MNNIKHYILNISPTGLLIQGYLFYLVVGWCLLSLPFFQQQTVGSLDALFIAASAVSTTGLVSIDPGSSFNFFGELTILLLIQLGGIGYMTFGSFILLSIKHKMVSKSLRISKRAFNLPKDFKVSMFIKKVVVFTLIVEAIGALFLYAFFKRAGIDDPIWFAIFHSISAFCTAGFSLMPNSFEGFQAHFGINIVISSLSLIGAIGFIVMVDIWDILRGRSKYLHFTSKVILKVSFGFLFFGTVFLALAEPSFERLPLEEKWMAAFFQVMTATTTVGFNTFSIGELAPATLVVMYFLMLFGASPSGTGGGLKSTTFAALVGLVKSTLKQRDSIRFNKRAIPLEKIQLAASSFAYYFAVLMTATVLLLLTEKASMEVVLFEIFSALGTVGLSMGLTADLTAMGKLIVILLMFMGRVGILTFGIIMSMSDESREEEEDNDLVM